MNKKTDTHWWEKRTISTYDVDFLNQLRIDSIFNYVQEAASNSAENLGWGYDALNKHGLFWVLTRASIQLKHTLYSGNQIEIETWPKGLEGIFARRDSRIYNHEKKVICNATSTWLMIDKQTGRPVKTHEWLSKFDFNDEEEAIPFTAPKIIGTNTSEKVYEKQIRYMDIDVNQHVNNVRYVGYILDCFTPAQFEENRIISFQINYLNELKIGDVLIISKSMISEHTSQYHIEGIRSNQTKIFQALVEWTKI